ncbi:rod shape-determining protein, partial [Veillonellaceae bacterium M1-70]|nr:rod shape-determining protein [Veillonellaceae bacterium M1-70]
MDLGTENIVIYVKKLGIAVNEPSVIAVDTERNTVVAVG